jgi:hypothetical protein
VKIKTFAHCLTLLFAFTGSHAFAQTDCGVLPEKPSIVDGTSATMEELVANSQEVKSYIGDVDSFLDCYDTFMQSSGFSELPQNEKLVYANAMDSILEARNAIGPEFNAQVEAFRAAQPEESE